MGWYQLIFWTLNVWVTWREWLVTQEHLTLQFPQVSKGSYTADLHDVSGQKLREEAIPTGASQANIDLTQVADGHYYLRVTNHSRQVTQTFKVQKIN